MQEPITWRVLGVIGGICAIGVSVFVAILMRMDDRIYAVNKRLLEMHRSEHQHTKQGKPIYPPHWRER